MARYTDVDPSNEPNRPHISSDIYQCQRAPETKSTGYATLLCSASAQLFPETSIPNLRGIRHRDPFRRPVSASARPVRGYLRITTNTRKREMRLTVTFFSKNQIFLSFQWFGCVMFLQKPDLDNKISAPQHRPLPDIEVSTDISTSDAANSPNHPGESLHPHQTHPVIPPEQPSKTRVASPKTRESGGKTHSWAGSKAFSQSP